MAAFNDASRKAALSGGPTPQLPANIQSAQRVLRSLNNVEGVVRGSAAERECMRRSMYGYSNQMGPAHFMLTLTPSEITSGMAATISAGNRTGLEMSLDGVDVVDKTRLIQEAVTKDPAACAQFFYGNMHICLPRPSRFRR